MRGWLARIPSGTALPRRTHITTDDESVPPAALGFTAKEADEEVGEPGLARLDCPSPPARPFYWLLATSWPSTRSPWAPAWTRTRRRAVTLPRATSGCWSFWGSDTFGNPVRFELLDTGDTPASVGESRLIQEAELHVSGFFVVTEARPVHIDPGLGCPVVARVTHLDDVLLLYTERSGAEPIRVTASHPFWSVTRETWVPAGELEPGEVLSAAEGLDRVETIVPSGLPRVEVFNLEVAGAHTYRVGAPGLAVHNCGLRTAAEAGISPDNARRIQNAANRTGQRITVVGSRAAGTAGLASDWDYIFSGPSRARHSARSSVRRGRAGGEVNVMGRETGIDVFQDYNPNAWNWNTLDPSRPHVIFEPQ